MNKFIEKLPTLPTVLIGGWMAIAPVFPEPHLVQKLMMAINGDSFKLIDVFDVFMHGGLAVIAVMKVWQEINRRPEASSNKNR